MTTKTLELEKPNPVQAQSSLLKELEWLKLVLKSRIDSYFNDKHMDFLSMPAPKLIDDSYGRLINRYKLNSKERLVLILALAAEISPDLLDILQSKNEIYNLPYAEFGGVLNLNRSGFKPTVQTALFLLSGADRQENLETLALFEADQTLFLDILRIENQDFIPDIPLKLTAECRQLLLFDREINQDYNAEFPASMLQSQYSWDDLVLSHSTREHLEELELWIKHRDYFIDEWKMGKSNNRGYKVLFHGPPGTGKSLTATLLGQKYKHPVYRIDLSQISSKYIGETEKNLERFFKKAEKQKWILFFDEADSLFGKRTNVKNSNDRHANQQTAYLLQRIEHCENLVILASNLIKNIDDAFLRRFQSIIKFSNPQEEERLKLWELGFSGKADLSKIKLSEFAREFKLNGAEINNVIRFASLMSINRDDKTIYAADLITAIRREKYKSGVLI